MRPGLGELRRSKPFTCLRMLGQVDVDHVKQDSRRHANKRIRPTFPPTLDLARVRNRSFESARRPRRLAGVARENRNALACKREGLVNIFF
jgi:hypothetical protein